MEQGRIDEGLASLREATAQAATLGQHSWPEAFSSALLARPYCKAGRADKGLEVLESRATTSDVRFYEPEIRRIQGELLLAQSPNAAPQTQACFRSAIELASAREEKSLELRAAMSLARLLLREGLREAAYTALAPVYASFNEGFATADLREARALLDELG